LAIALGTYQAIDLNFFNYDNDKKTVDLSSIEADYRPQYYVYVYAHTRREMLSLVDEIERIAKASGEGSRVGITLVSPDYWPLPWYLRDYPRVGYHGRMTSTNEPIIIAKEEQQAEVLAMFGDRYAQVTSGFNEIGSYPLRPAVDLLLYVRNDVRR
jgi:predicted membrane-bound mannosyltransferase